MRVIGLDPSLTSFGAACVDQAGSVVWSEAKRSKERGVARLSDIRWWIKDSLMAELDRRVVQDPTADPIDPPGLLVAVEGYSHGSAHAAHHMGELGGMVRLVLFDLGVEAVQVQPSTLKKVVSGKGNTPKDEMRLEIYKRFSLEAKSQDELEAQALGFTGWYWLVAQGRVDVFGGPALPAGNLEGLKKIEVVA